MQYWRDYSIQERESLTNAAAARRSRARRPLPALISQSSLTTDGWPAVGQGGGQRGRERSAGVSAPPRRAPEANGFITAVVLIAL